MFSRKKDYKSHFEKGVALFNERRYSEMISELNEAIDANGESAEAYFYKGKALEELKNYGAALNAYTTTAKLDRV